MTSPEGTAPATSGAPGNTTSSTTTTTTSNGPKG
jgi:hypothetical protein